MHAKLGAILVFTIALVSLHSAAYACALCASAEMWKAYPPELIWARIGIVWYLALVITAAIWKQKMWMIPRIGRGLAFAGLGLIGNASPMGPFAIILFLPFAFLGSIAALINRSQIHPRKLLGMVSLFGTVAMGIITITIVRETLHPTHRSPVDIILRWEGTDSEIQAFKRLKSEEPDSVESYREILRKAKYYALSKAAIQLAAIGNPNIDVPLVIDALERTRATPYVFVASDIEKALQKMTGLSLPEGTSAQEWRKAWADRESGAKEAGN